MYKILPGQTQAPRILWVLKTVLKRDHTFFYSCEPLTHRYVFICLFTKEFVCKPLQTKICITRPSVIYLNGGMKRTSNFDSLILYILGLVSAAASTNHQLSNFLIRWERVNCNSFTVLNYVKQARKLIVLISVIP